MTETYEDFKRKYPAGSSVAKPFPPFDFAGECVSYTLTKAVEVDGVPFAAPLGDAAQIPLHPTFRQYYQQVALPIPGDLMFWGDDSGTWTGPEGHTALYDAPGLMMNQNFNGSRVVSKNAIFTPGFIGYFRVKEEQVSKPTYDEVLSQFRTFIGQDPTEQQQNYYVARDWGTLNGDLLRYTSDRLKEAHSQAQAAGAPNEDAKKWQQLASLLGVK